jgi:hypothetical protein
MDQWNHRWNDRSIDQSINLNRKMSNKWKRNIRLEANKLSSPDPLRPWGGLVGLDVVTPPFRTRQNRKKSFFWGTLQSRLTQIMNISSHRLIRVTVSLKWKNGMM